MPATKNEQQLLLLQKSAELFKKHGVKGLTMDDVAKELGMSKKTIYKFVKDKGDLIKKSMELYLEGDRQQLEAIANKPGNSIERMIQMVAYFFKQLAEFDPSTVTDLQKHYSEAWELYNDYQYKYMLSLICSNLAEGINEGYYRNDFNADIISKIYISAVYALMDQRLFPAKEYVFLTIYKEFLQYHLHGIVSQKGLEYLEQHNLFRN